LIHIAALRVYTRDYKEISQNSLPEDGGVTVQVYDMLRREITVFIEGFAEAGLYRKESNATALSSELYFTRIEFNGESLLHTFLLLK
jgi:hypothetical protein